jgi:predicted DNA-binding transcriptional regulator YafY
LRRADRLFQIESFLQGRRYAVTARVIAEDFGVGERTIYRDIRDLMLSGVPVTGEAGVGYVLDVGYHLPPIMFDVEEIEAMLLGIAMVSSWTDDKTATAARRALSKIRNVLGENEREILAGTSLFAPPSESQIPWSVDFSFLKASVRAKQKLALDYVDQNKDASQRVVRPLALVFLGPVWVLLAWCEMRRDFRKFRLDRIETAAPTGENFADEPGKRVKDYLILANYDDGLRG